MDLKFKSPKWVGGLYNTFEAMCHEVDDFMSQETAKFVETQTQAVTGAVKRLYSNVVQDLLPSSLAQPGKHETRLPSHKENDTVGTYIRSIKGIEEKQVHRDINSGDVRHGQLKDHYCADFTSEAESNLSSGSGVRDLNHNKSDVVLGENYEKVKLLDKKTDLLFEQNDVKEELMSRNSNNFEAINSTEEHYQPEDLSLCPGNQDSPESLLSSECIEEKNGIQSVLPSAVSVCNTEKNEVACDACTGDFDRISEISNLFSPSELNSPVVSIENKTIRGGLDSSTISLLSETADVPYKEENICYNPVDETGCFSDPLDATSSSQPLPMLPCDDMDMKLAFFSSAVSLGSNCQADDATDPRMETIDLSEKEKLDESCIMVENRSLNAMSSRSQKQRSYKKILQDAFASRKRLRKEYEQLGILFGDIDIKSSPRSEQSLLPQIPSSSLGSKKSSSSDLSEWELL